MDGRRGRRATTFPGICVGGPYARVGSSTSTTFLDTALADGTGSYYQVQGTAFSGASTDSNTANAWTLSAPPASVIATPGVRQVTLTWTPAVGATSYRVLRATVPGGPYTQFASVTTTTATDLNRVSGTTYHYVVRSQNAAGIGPDSQEVSATAQ